MHAHCPSTIFFFFFFLLQYVVLLRGPVLVGPMFFLCRWRILANKMSALAALEAGGARQAVALWLVFCPRPGCAAPHHEKSLRY